ncbi:MAG TPA: copper chaperone PCu(A)C [Geminicoccaceae bacterium]|jgi:copper(I)-binding protein|nr:copper chaperone PCu(A)C [Geminicoccaceae bacterium]
MTGRSIKECMAAAVLLLALAGVVRAGPMASVGEVAVHDAWARASIGRMRTSAVYLTLEVTGEQVDRLIAAASPVAKTAGLHSHVMDGEVARMRPVAAIEIAPGAPTVLERGGLHIMLTGLKQPLVEGETVPLSLTFERAGTVEFEVPIKGMASSMSHDARPPAHEPATH